MRGYETAATCIHMVSILVLEVLTSNHFTCYKHSPPRSLILDRHDYDRLSREQRSAQFNFNMKLEVNNAADVRDTADDVRDWFCNQSPARSRELIGEAGQGCCRRDSAPGIPHSTPMRARHIVRAFDST